MVSKDRDLESLAITQKIYDAVKRHGINDVFKVKVMEREVDVLPYFTNIFTYMGEEYRDELKQILMREYTIDDYCECVKDKQNKVITEYYGLNNFTLLRGLTGWYDGKTKRTELLFACKDKKSVISIMGRLCYAKIKTINDDEVDVLDYPEGVDNTLGVSYLISLKWYIDKVSGKMTDKHKQIVEKLERQIKSSRTMYDYFTTSMSEISWLQVRLRKDKDRMSAMNEEYFVTIGLDPNKLPIPLFDEDWDLFNLILDSKLRYDGEIITHEILEVMWLSGGICNWLKTKDDLNVKNIELEKEMQLVICRELEAKGKVKNITSQLSNLKEDIHKVEIERDKFKVRAERLERERDYEKDDEIAKLKEEVSRLKEEKKQDEKKALEFKREMSRLKKENKCLHSSNMKQTELLERKEEVIVQLNKQINVDDTIPFEVVRKRLEGYKIAIIGDRAITVKKLKEMGLCAKGFEGRVGITARELGDYDCLVILTDNVSHTATWGPKEAAKLANKPIINVNSSNVCLMCRYILEELDK